MDGKTNDTIDGTANEPINIHNENTTLNRNQGDYNAYNTLMFSEDRNIIFKLLMRHRLYEMIRHLHGDIVECGVFKGSGLVAWLKMMDMDTPHDIRKVIGFDFFDLSFTKTLEKDDKVYMDQVFTRCDVTMGDISRETISSKLVGAGFPEDKFELVKGDITQTSSVYVKSRPGFRISLLYMDLDLEEPTYEALTNFWDNIVPGGIVVFDEYAYHVWSEANAVDRFVCERGLTLHKLDIKAPTAFIVKE